MEQALTNRRIVVARPRKSAVRVAVRQCPECGQAMKSSPLEVLTGFGGWHVGWRKHACGRCGLTESRMEILHAASGLQFQTHVVC